MAREPIEPLTAREQSVLDLLRRGLTNAQIADDLDMSENTAKTHVAAILRKLAVRSRHEAAYWPEEAPWWERVPLVAPLARILGQRGSSPTSLPLVVTLFASGALLLVVAGLGLLAFLVLRSGGSQTVISNDPQDLGPGTTLHMVSEKWRRYGPAADIYAEYFPETGPELAINESWMVFDDDGLLEDIRAESRSEDGDLIGTSSLEDGAMVYRNGEGEETNRLPGIGDISTVDALRERLREALDGRNAELQTHPEAPTVTIDGVEYRMVESRSPFTRGVSGPASANSFSAPYLYDLDPVETIHRSYFPSDSTSYRYRWEDWVVDADGTETLVEYSNDILMEVLEN